MEWIEHLRWFVCPEYCRPYLRWHRAGRQYRYSCKSKRKIKGSLDDEVLRRELEAFERADNRSGEAARLKELLCDLLYLGGGDALQHDNQLLRREMAIKVHVIARKAAHTRARAFQGQ